MGGGEAMRKTIFTILLFVFASIVFADPVIDVNAITVEMLDYLIDKAPIGYVPPSIAIGPYDATTGISMNSKEYPRRTEGEKLNFVGEYNYAPEINQTPENGYYTNKSMVALGALYDVPIVFVVSNNTTEETEQTGWQYNYWPSYYYRDKTITENVSLEIAILSKSKPAMRFSAESSSDFMFVSQSHPTYRRPFDLAIQPKYLITNYANSLEYHSASGIPLGVKVLGNGLDNNPSINLPDNVSLGLYASFWFDVILVLPFDDFDVDNGVQVDNIKYELVEADDYSSIVNLSVQYDQMEYEVYTIKGTRTIKQRQTGELGWSGVEPTSEWITQETSYNLEREGNGSIQTVANGGDIITIPFSGYYSPYDNGMTESSASFHVSTYPIISNLSLNPSSSTNPRTYIDIADLNLIYMFGDRYQPRENITDNTCDISKNDNPRIFLSASNDPKDQNSNGFMFIHRGATRIVEGVNAVRYSVRVTDDKGRFTDFDGTDYIGDSYQMVGTDKFLYSEHHYTNPFWHVYSNGARQLHYHSYDGTISILIDDTNQNLMQAGVYESTIYVHLITS